MNDFKLVINSAEYSIHPPLKGIEFQCCFEVVRKVVTFHMITEAFLDKAGSLAL